MNHLVIDLEMCEVSKIYRRSYKYFREIIQIGAVLLDEDFQKIAELRQYVRPQYGIVDKFIESLTGISNKELKHAPMLADALRYLQNWIGEREYDIYAWSDSDFSQLKREITAKGIEDQTIFDFIREDRWIDYQAVFTDRGDYGRRISLEEALDLCCIEPEGRMHDGLCDAANTGRLIKKLEMNPDYVIPNIVKEICGGQTEPLSYSMGNLFAGFKLLAALN